MKVVSRTSPHSGPLLNDVITSVSPERTGVNRNATIELVEGEVEIGAEGQMIRLEEIPLGSRPDGDSGRAEDGDASEASRGSPFCALVPLVPTPSLPQVGSNTVVHRYWHNFFN